MQIDSPNKDREPKMVVDGKAYYYTKARHEKVTNYVPINPDNPKSGLRKVTSTVVVPEDAEIIDLETGESDSKYWQPETVLNPEGCSHVFALVDVGKREVQCKKCTLSTTIHLGINVRENPSLQVNLQSHWYPVETT